MTGSITAEIQAAGPEILYVIEEAGQDVTIVRSGQPDTPARAVVYQLDDTSRVTQPGPPEFKVVAWQGIFRPDAPIRTGPFSVVTASGLMLTPDGPVQDPGHQGVALIAHLLPLAGRTRAETLTFSVPGSGTVKDAAGNDRPAPGTPLTVTARLTASTDTRIRDTLGADGAEVALIGRWGSLSAPQGRPAGVKWGSQSPLTLDGQTGTLTVKLAYPDSDLATEAQFGARFLAIWRATP